MGSGRTRVLLWVVVISAICLACSGHEVEPEQKKVQLSSATADTCPCCRYRSRRRRLRASVRASAGTRPRSSPRQATTANREFTTSWSRSRIATSSRRSILRAIARGLGEIARGLRDLVRGGIGSLTSRSALTVTINVLNTDADFPPVTPMLSVIGGPTRGAPVVISGARVEASSGLAADFGTLDGTNTATVQVVNGTRPRVCVSTENGAAW
jgi:hypothetical protein